jgi:NADH dehydrogenase FAD-containing subunit
LELQICHKRRALVFAVGDISTADCKMAGFARHQAATVADNINSLAQGRSDLAHYELMGVAIAVPIGPTGGQVSSPDRARSWAARPFPS